MSAPLDRSGRYWPRYCEENVWHLCRELTERGQAGFAVLISNAGRRLAMWRQTAAPDPDTPLGWDYHVITVVREAAEDHVYDPDSTLPWPCPLLDYLDASFRPDWPVPDAFRPRFRLVDAHLYVATLRTDRRHMRRADGRWLAPPPPWPTIGTGSNLAELIDMGRPEPGALHDLASLRALARTAKP